MEFPLRNISSSSSSSFNEECLPRRRIIATNPEQAEHKNNSSPGQQGRPLPHCWYVFSLSISLSLSLLFLRAYTLYGRSGVPRCMWVKLTMHGTRLAGTKDVRFLKYCHQKAISARRPTEDFPDGRRSFGRPLCWRKGERREERKKGRKKKGRGDPLTQDVFVSTSPEENSSEGRATLFADAFCVYWVCTYWVKLVNGKVDQCFCFQLEKLLFWYFEIDEVQNQ